MTYLAQLIDDVVVNKVELNEQTISIGRHPDNTIQINDEAVSGKHAIITVKSSDYLDNTLEVFMEDLGSTNGSMINNKNIKGKVQLSHQDVIRIGWNEFKLVQQNDDALEKTAHALNL